MDEAVIKYYRNLLRTRFEHAGTIENPSVFIDTVGTKVLLCGNTGDFMQLYATVADNKITDIKYNCCCDPTANVAVEILCILTKGKTLEEVAAITEQDCAQYLGSHGEEFLKKARGLLELLNLGIQGYKERTAVPMKEAD